MTFVTASFFCGQPLTNVFAYTYDKINVDYISSLERQGAILTENHFRKSIRDFKDTPITTAQLTQIITEAARATPSWEDSQPWRVYIATQKTLQAIKAQHLAHAQNGTVAHSDFRVKKMAQWAKRPQENMAHWVETFNAYTTKNELPELDQSTLYHVPAIVYLTLDQNHAEWSLYDLGAFGQSIMNAALKQGIDSITAYEFVKYAKSVRQLMTIPDSEVLVMGIGLGYRSDNPINGFTSDRNDVKTFMTIKD